MIKPEENRSVIAEHEPIGYSYLIINRHEDVVEKRSYFGEDPVNNFVDSLSEAWRIIKESVVSYPISMSAEDEVHFKRQRHCELCRQPFNVKNPLHKHHDHSLPQIIYKGRACDATSSVVT